MNHCSACLSIYLLLFKHNRELVTEKAADAWFVTQEA
jgi:hypothetical protein